MHARANALEDEVRRIRATAIDDSSLTARQRFGRWIEGATGSNDRERGRVEAALNSAESEIAVAREAVEFKRSGRQRLHPRRLIAWASGADQETAWLALHGAECELVLVRPEPALRSEIPRLLAKVDASFSTATEPGKGRTEILIAQQKASQLDRQALREIKQAVLGESDKQFERLRSFRNILVAAIFILVVVEAGLALIPSLMTSWVEFCPSTSAASGADPNVTAACPVDTVWKVELLGAIGGLLAALAALQKLRGYRNPYNLPFVQALLKIPAGALTALIGTIIVQSGAFSIDPVDGNKLVAYVILFGVAQELVTRLIDQKANSIIEAANPSTASGT